MTYIIVEVRFIEEGELKRRVLRAVEDFWRQWSIYIDENLNVEVRGAETVKKLARLSIEVRYA